MKLKVMIREIETSMKIQSVLYKMTKFVKPLKFAGFLWMWQARRFRGRHFSRSICQSSTRLASAVEGSSLEVGKIVLEALREKLPKSAFEADALDFFSAHSAMPLDALYAAIKAFVNRIQKFSPCDGCWVESEGVQDVEIPCKLPQTDHH